MSSDNLKGPPTVDSATDPNMPKEKEGEPSPANGIVAINYLSPLGTPDI